MSIQHAPKKIALLGLFGQLNLGNDSTLLSMVHHTRLRIPEVELLCVCTGPEDITARFGIPAVDMYAPSPEARRAKTRLGRAVKRLGRELRHGYEASRQLGGTDMLIVPGTGILVDNTTGFQGYPFYLFKWILIAKMRGCKVAFVSVGAGPILGRISKLLFRHTLKMAAYRSYRDDYSKKYLAGIGFDTSNDPVVPDLAFGLYETLVDKEPPVSRGTSVAVGFIDYYGQGSENIIFGEESYRTYLAKMANFIEWLSKQHYSVRLIIGDREYDEAARSDALKLLINRIGNVADVGIISNEIDTSEDLATEIANTDFVVSPRYHNVIFALLLGKPAIALSYNKKAEALMAGYGLDSFCQSLDTLDVEMLKDQVRGLEDLDKSIVTSIYERSAANYGSVNKQLDLVLCGSA